LSGITGLACKTAFFSLIITIIFSGCKRPDSAPGSTDPADEYYVAAYVWPSCHDEPMSRKAFWGEGIGEWEIIKKGTPRFEGHYQPRVPLWGYQMDDDPLAVEKKIAAATDHGVNVFIYDWFWYEGKPFLEEALNEGFLKARNNEQMDFYLMWTVHHVNGYMWNHKRYPPDSIVWSADVDRENYELIVDRLIERYFSRPNYFRIDGEPVLSIYGLTNLVNCFGSLAGTRDALDYFRSEVRKAGFPGLHIQVIGFAAKGNLYLLGEPYAEGKTMNEVVATLGINSVTSYAWIDRKIQDYLVWAEKSMVLWDKWDRTLEVPYFPTVSIGWDNTPRYPEYGKEWVVHMNNTPESFGAYLLKAREYADRHPEQPKLITINAWNEWVEGSYLEPDMRWGYAYLEAVKEVMSGKYDGY
jgi:hypothetical protein